MNPQNVTYSQQQGPRLKKPIKIALVAMLIIVALVGAATLASLFIKPKSPEKITDADTVSFASIANLPSGFKQTTNKSLTIINKQDNTCLVSYGILPSTQYRGSSISEYLAQITTELRSDGWDVSDGIDVDPVSVASTNGDKTYKIPTQQATYTDGSLTHTANYSIQKLKNKKFLTISETCSALGNNDPAAYMSNMTPIIKLLQVDVKVTSK